MLTNIIVVIVLLHFFSSSAFKLRTRNNDDTPEYQYFGSCFTDMSSLPTETMKIQPRGPLVPIVTGTVSTSSKLPGSDRFVDGAINSGPENYGVLNSLHFSIFEGQSQAESCRTAPFFSVKVSEIVDLKPSFSGDFMPSAERSSYCFKMFTKLTTKSASICAPTRSERSVFMRAIKNQIDLSKSLRGTPSGVLSSDEIDELAKERVKSYLLGEGVVATDDQLPESGDESKAVVFPPAKGSICALNGNVCLSSLPSSLNETKSYVRVVAAPSQWASSYPHPIASRRQRWKVVPSDEGVRVCVFLLFLSLRVSSVLFCPTSLSLSLPLSIAVFLSFILTPHVALHCRYAFVHTKNGWQRNHVFLFLLDRSTRRR